MTVYQLLLGIQYTSILLMLFMCIYVTRRWKKPLHGWLFFYCMATLVNNAGYLAVMRAMDEQAAILALQVSYLGRVWIPYTLLQFVLTLCERKRYPVVSDLLAVFHATTYFLVLGIRFNRLYYTSYSFVQEGIFPHLIHTNGIWHYASDLLIIAYMLYGMTNLIGLLRSQRNTRRRKQVALIIAAIAVDGLFFVLEIGGAMADYDVTILGYTLATFLLYVAIFRYDMLGTKELARDFIMEQVTEGVVITDEDGAVVDSNRKAKAILPSLVTEPQAALRQLQTLCAENQSLRAEEKWYTPKENLLIDENHVSGRVYLLSDDTAHYRRAEKLTREMMLALSKAVDAKDHYTNGHSQRVAQYARELARRMGKSEEEQEKLYEMGLLHDIGKIGVSEEIINKSSRLTDAEFARIKEHTVIGCTILREISVMPELAEGARSHHERYDGRGYPDGLQGEDIPEAARIICLADSYDAMTSTRTYSTPKPQAAVRAEILRCKGTQFDPAIADVMISMIDDDPEYRMHE